MSELLKKMGLCMVGDKIMPSPEYLAEIIKLTTTGMLDSDGKTIKITRKVGQDLLQRKFDTAEFISGILSGREDDNFKDLMGRIESRLDKANA